VLYNNLWNAAVSNFGKSHCTGPKSIRATFTTVIWTEWFVLKNTCSWHTANVTSWSLEECAVRMCRWHQCSTLQLNTGYNKAVISKDGAAPSEGTWQTNGSEHSVFNVSCLANFPPKLLNLNRDWVLACFTNSNTHTVRWHHSRIVNSCK
jgi:hypothetical protein